jgi:hypothetical protein
MHEQFPNRSQRDEDECQEGGGRAMTNQDYTTTFFVDHSPKEVFDTINNPRGWWSEEIEGATNKVGSIFKYQYKDVHHCRIKVTELIPEKKISWLVLDNYFNFTQDKSEWRGTRIVFDISKKGSKTKVRFTHIGLVPNYECYNVCRDAWGSYIKGSLRTLIITGNPIKQAGKSKK